MEYRSFFAATMLAAFLFAPQAEAQTTSAMDPKAPLLAAEKKEADASPAAPAPFRINASMNGKESKPVRFHRKQFFLLSAGVYAAASADMHQTLQVRHYSWWSETDPLARPLVKLPAPAYYATGLALATGVNWLSWKMGHSRRWRKLAPLPQLLAIGGNTYGFKSNCYAGY